MKSIIEVLNHMTSVRGGLRLCVLVLYMVVCLTMSGCVLVLGEESEGPENDKAAKTGFQNGDFSQGKKHWKFGAYDNSDASCEIVNGEAVINVTDTGSEKADIIVEQDSFFLQQGKTYKLTFHARSDIGRIIRPVFQLAEEPYTKYLDCNFILTNEMKQYSYEFEMCLPTDLTADFELHLGSFSGDENRNTTIYLDSFTLEKITENESEQNVTGANLIQNGEFDLGETNWELVTQRHADVRFRERQEEAFLDMVYNGPDLNMDDVIFRYTGTLDLVDGRRYVLSFEAQHGDDYGDVTLVSYCCGSGRASSLTSSRKTFYHSFVYESTYQYTVNFALGGIVHNEEEPYFYNWVFIDHVELYEAE